MPSSFNPALKIATAVLAVFLAVGTLALVQGCKSSVPPTGAYPTPNSLVNQSRVDEFQDSGVPQLYYINPYLFELNNPPSYELKEGWINVSGSVQPASV